MTETLHIALEKVAFFPPGRVTDDTSILTLKQLVFEPLLRWDDGYARPGLFARWEHDATGCRWRFDIRPGAVFHDGKPCVAEDILGFIEHIQTATDTFGMRWSYARYLAAARFSAASRSSIVMENPAPFADILDILSEFFVCRVAGDGTATLGTGPYRVAAYAPQASATLERVGANGGPARIVATAMPQAEARLEALRNATVQAALNLERLHAAPDFAPDLAWQRATNTLSVMYYLNCTRGLFTSAAARSAVNHAVDVQAIIDGLFHGLGMRAATVVSPFHLGHHAAGVSPHAHDPELARRLFDKAPPAGELVIRTPESMPERAREVSEMVRDSLARVGMPARLEVQTDRPEYAREIGRKAMGDMAIFDSSPHSTYRILNDKISSAVRAVWWQGHDDAALEPMILAANRTVDFAARERAYGRCLARLHDNPPWLYLFHPIEVCAVRHGLGGLVLDHKGVLNLAP